MPVKQPKKLLIMNILDILRKYSDEEHRLSQKDIAEILKTEYDMTADRKAIRRNILNLMDCGYNIEYSESIRMVPNPKTGVPEERYPEIEAELVAKLKSKVGVTVTPKAVPLSYLPRSEKKTSRFFDNRY